LDRHEISMRLRQVAAAPPATNPAGRVCLEDLLGQGRYESEAETNILAAFEAQQNNRNQHYRSPSTSSTIFSGIPGSLSNEMVMSDHDHDTDIGDDPDLRDASFKSTDEDSQIDGASQPRVPSHTHSNEENQALLNERNNNAPATNDKSRSQNQFKRIAKKAYAHRRIMSVEDQLAGLQYAMSAFQDAATHSDNAQDGSLDMTDSTDNSSNDDGPGVNATAGELLGHHAGLLLDPGTPGNRSRLNTADAGHLPTLQEEDAKNKEAERTGSSSMDLSDRTDGPTADIENAMNQHPGDQTTSNNGESSRKNKKSKHRRRLISSAADKVKDDLEAWQNFFSPRSDTFWVYVKRMLLYVVAPFTGIAAVLFYFATNPPTGKSEDGDPGDMASASWWLLFVVRQVVTFSIALGLQSLIIDFLCVGSRLMVHCLGPVLTLLIVQSKGWPFVTVSLLSRTVIAFCTACDLLT
jgi:hypothetical protein